MPTDTVKELWRFPVKSFGGEQLEEAEFEADGLLGDRAFALIETETIKVVSAKSVEKFSTILDCHFGNKVGRQWWKGIREDYESDAEFVKMVDKILSKEDLDQNRKTLENMLLPKDESE